MALLHIDFEPNGPQATYLQSDSPTRTRGARVSLELAFDPDGGPGYGNDYGSEYGLGEGVTEYNRMVDRLEYVDPIFTGLSHDGVPWVDEDLPARAPFTSQIFEVVPGDDVTDIDPFWGVIVGGQDTSRPPRGLRTMTVELVFLADGSRYATRDELRNDIGATSL